MSFPKPPLAAGGNIIALETPDMVIEEGREQENCAMSYAKDIANGAVYLYRVLEPERATLSIVPDESGGWRLGQLLRACNEPVTEETNQGVVRWLSQAR